ncbi:hypothetical protein K3F43_10485 [Pseudomonas tussilaginis]|uniref:hypothetical protein n=1 Tax=unclassified Pseudomonas TaxID=196821 RepID=UPI000C6E0D08|nr:MULTISPECIES: hypothetical protein [unclassified Pseudomonas]QYX49891.1 hypothetical protein K3F43_10485 [Pseudomonas sp. S11A 273]
MVGPQRLPWTNTRKALQAPVDFNEINTFALQTLGEREKSQWPFGICQKIVANLRSFSIPSATSVPFAAKKIELFLAPEKCTPDLNQWVA